MYQDFRDAQLCGRKLANQQKTTSRSNFFRCTIKSIGEDALGHREILVVRGEDCRDARSLIKIKYFDEADTCAAITAGGDGGIGARRKSEHDG